MSGFSKQSAKKGVDAEREHERRVSNSISLRKKKIREFLEKRRCEGNEESSHITHESPDLAGLFKDLFSQDLSKVMPALATIRRVLSKEDAPLDDFIKVNGLSRLVVLLKEKSHPPMQLEAAWALTNAAAGEPHHTKAVAESGAIPVLLEVMQQGNSEITLQSIWALGNIAGDDNIAYRNGLLELGILNVINNIIQTQAKSKSLLRTTVWCLANLCRGRPPPAEQYAAPALLALASLVFESRDEEVLSDACWGLCHLSERYQSQLIQVNVVTRLVALLTESEYRIQNPALFTLGNILSSEDLSHTQAVINAGILGPLHLLLSNPNKTIRKNCLWALSNIAAGDVHHVQSVIQGSFVSPVLEFAKSGENIIKKEAIYVLYNMCGSGTPEQVEFLINEGVIPILCESLKSIPEIIDPILHTFDYIFKVGELKRQRFGGENKYVRMVLEAGGVDKIEELQSHASKEIGKLATQLLVDFFEFEDDFEKEQQYPVVPNGQFDSASAQPQQFATFEQQQSQKPAQETQHHEQSKVCHF